MLKKFRELCFSILSFLRDALSDSKNSILAKSDLFTVTCICDCESSDSFTNVKLQHGSEDKEHSLSKLPARDPDQYKQLEEESLTCCY